MAQQDQIDTRTKILTEAERLFRHYGYAKTTIADIADACRMSPANLYRFFASKSALVEAICGKTFCDTEGRLLEIVHSGETASRRLERLIAEIHRNTVEDYLDHKKVHEIVVVAMEEQWHAVKAHLERVCLFIQQIIEDGVAAGEYPGQDTVRAAKCTQSAIVHLCHPVVVAQKLDDQARITPEEMARFIVSALKCNG